MPRLTRRLTDYDLAVRVLDNSEKIGSRSTSLINEFLEDSESRQQLEKRKKLLSTLRHYRNPENLEEYHADHFQIQTKSEGIVPFLWKPAQRVLFYSYILPNLLANKPIRVYILKARQIGFSTLIEGISSALASLYCDFHSMVLAHDKNTSAKIFKMCKLYYKGLDPSFKPARKLSNRYELEFANPIEDEQLGLESSITVNTAQNLHNVGGTLKFLHLSEFARYEEVISDAEEGIVSLLQQVPRKGFTFVFIETTAYGEGIGKRFWDNPNNGFDKVFISWIADESYTHEEPVTDTLNYDDSHKYGNEEKALSEIIDELKVWNPDQSQDEEWLKYEALCRLNWRRTYIDEQTFGKVELFHENYPLTPEEAFRVKGRSVFNINVLTTQKKRAELIKPNRYIYHPNPDTKKLGEFLKNDLGPFKVVFPPYPGERYWIGADTSAGLKDGDSSALQVLDMKYNQVATYRDIIEPDDLAAPLVKLAKWYNNARIVPESNAMGISTINKMVKDFHYTNIYIREKINTLSGGIQNEWGFYTSGKTRPILLNYLRQLISSNQIQIYDLETIEQLLAFVYTIKNGKLRMDHAPGQHDDLVLSLALGAFDIQEIDEEQDHSDNPPPDSIEAFARENETPGSSWSRMYGNVTGV